MVHGLLELYAATGDVAHLKVSRVIVLFPCLPACGASSTGARLCTLPRPTPDSPTPVPSPEPSHLHPEKHTPPFHMGPLYPTTLHNPDTLPPTAPLSCM